MKIVVLIFDNPYSRILLNSLKDREDLSAVIVSDKIFPKQNTFQTFKTLLKKTAFSYFFYKLLEKLFFDIHVLFTGKSLKKIIKPVYKIKDINSKKSVNLLKKLNPDLIVSIYYHQLLKKEVLSIPRLGCINVHPAFLPYYGGLAPYVWALANNEKFTGITVHYMNEKYDEGNIILREKVFIKAEDTAQSLVLRNSIAGTKILNKAIEIVNKKGKGRKEKLKSYYSWPDKKAMSLLRKNKNKLFRFKDLLKIV